MRRIELSALWTTAAPRPSVLRRVLPRAEVDVGAALQAVTPLVEDVAARGYAAAREATMRLDGVDVADPRVPSAALQRALDELERLEEESGEKNHTLLSDDDLEIDWSEVPENLINREDVTPENFGRIAAQTAKQVILQRIREAERDMMFEEYRDRVGELITGIVQKSDSRYTLVQLRERVEALLPKSEQVDGERYDHSQRIKAVIKDVSNSTKGPSIIVSRRDPELIKSLFELEVPEIADGLVEITGVAREPGRAALGQRRPLARMAAQRPEDSSSS